MGRKRTGTVESRVDAQGVQYYRVLIRLDDGSRVRLIAAPGMSEARARDWASACQAKEDRDGLLLAKKQGDAAKIALITGETFAKYVDRWIADRKERGISAWDTDAGYLKKHIVPLLGTIPIVSVSKDAVEDVRDTLDKKVRAGVFKWKTAQNVWGLVTKLFDDACKSKIRALRVLTSNPADGVLPPDKGDETSKQYLYPTEFLQLVACEDVPLRFRRLFCLAVYLYSRAGEINALEFGRGIDRKRGVAEITEQVDRRTSLRKSTKTGLTRRLPIEPNLDPLLAVLEKEAGGVGRVAQVSETDRKLALTLRRCLKLAGVDRRALHETTPTMKPIGFHDLRATGITWCAIRGDDPLKLMQRAGHKGFATTQKYIREADNLREGFGSVFPELPQAVLISSTNRPRFDTEQVKTLKSQAKQARERVEAPGIEDGANAMFSDNSPENCDIWQSDTPQSDEAKCAIAGSYRPPIAHRIRTSHGGLRPLQRVARGTGGARVPVRRGGRP